MIGTAKAAKKMTKHPTSTKFNASELLVAGLLAWLIPGAGHFYLGLRKRAALLFVCIEVSFIIGLYIGTVRIIDPGRNLLWFSAQIFAGLNTIVAHMWASHLASPYPGSSEMLVRDWSYSMGVLYTGVAGLLNLLAVFDTVIRAGRANTGQVPLPAD